MTAPLRVHIGQLILDGWSNRSGDAQEFAAAFTSALEQALGGEPAPTPTSAGAGPLAARPTAVDSAARSAASAARRAAAAITPVINAERP